MASPQSWLQDVLKSPEGLSKPLDFWDMDDLLNKSRVSGSPVDSPSSPESTEETTTQPMITGWEDFLNQPDFLSSPDSFLVSPPSSTDALPALGFSSSFPSSLASSQPSSESPFSPEDSSTDFISLVASFQSDQDSYETPFEVVISAPNSLMSEDSVRPGLSESSSCNSRVSSTEAEDEEEEQDELVELKSVMDSPALTLKSAGLPKMAPKVSARRVAGGHVMSNVVIEEGEERGPDDDWRPSPEEYKALSSKQKRQLRNKISARNFRNRRKDYISQLEGHLGERDEIIAAVRTELGSTQWENEALRREISALKNAVNLRRPSSDRSAPSPFFGNTVDPSKLQPASTSTATSTAPNDTIFSPSTYFPFVPNPTLPPSSKPQPNLNPLYNTFPSLPHTFLHAHPTALPSGTSQTGTFDQFVDSTPFGLRSETVDLWKNQLWTRLAREEAWNQAGSSSGGLKPAFWTTSAASIGGDGSVSREKKASLGGIWSSIYYRPSSILPPSVHSTPPPPYNEVEPASFTHRLDMSPAESAVHQSIASKMSKAFFEAFVTPSPSLHPPSFTKPAHRSSSPSMNLIPPKPSLAFDFDKLTSLLTGRSRIEIVPNNRIASTSSASSLLAQMKEEGAKPIPSPRETCRALEMALQGLSLDGPLVRSKEGGKVGKERAGVFGI